MNRRRLVLATCLVAVLTGGAGAALADTSPKGTAPAGVTTPGGGHYVCLVLANQSSPGHPTHDLCIDTP